MNIFTPAAARRMTMAMLRKPKVKWEAAINLMSHDERRAIDDSAACLATEATRLSAYISRRESGGKHADAVKAQNRAARQTRQALGFTYADDSFSF